MRVLISLMLLLSGTVRTVHAQQWTVYDMENSPLPSTTVKALEADGHGGLWVGTDWGLCHFDGMDAWTIYQEGTSPLVENNIRCLELDAEGRLWIGTESMGLQLKDGDDWLTFQPDNSPLPEFDIRDLFIDASNTLWVCTPGGLARFDGTTWNIYDDTQDSHDGAVLGTSNTNAVAVAADGTICLGTFNGGLHFIQGSSVEVLTSFEDGFFDNTAVAVAFHPLTGARWVATPAAGLLRQQGPVVGGVWSQWSTTVGFPTNATTSMSIDVAGDVWVGTQVAGLIRVEDNGAFVQYTRENSGIPDNTVRSVMAADDGAIWAGTFLGGLARLDPNVGLTERISEPRVQVHPNPARDRFNVVSRGGLIDGKWELFQADGASVAHGVITTEHLVIQVDGLPAGCYILQVRSRDSVDVVKVFVG